MSAISSIRALPDRTERPARRLTGLPRPVIRRGPRVAHGVVAIAGLGAIIAAQLGMSVAVSEGAYEMQSLQSQSAALSREEQALQEQIAVLESPQHVALAAEDLGMVTGPATSFLQLSDGSVIGGPDALHMEQEAVTAGGSLLVGSELLQPADEPVAATEEAEPEEYPGMLLPAEGVAD